MTTCSKCGQECAAIDQYGFTCCDYANPETCREYIAKVWSEIGTWREVDGWQTHCVCGCDIDDHDRYDDGIGCEHDDHNCVLISKAAFEVVKDLRAERDELSTKRLEACNVALDRACEIERLQVEKAFSEIEIADLKSFVVKLRGKADPKEWTGINALTAENAFLRAVLKGMLSKYPHGSTDLTCCGCDACKAAKQALWSKPIDRKYKDPQPHHVIPMHQKGQ